MRLKVKTPAKVNLTLDVLGLRSDGYHEIASVMQTISLYDYLTFDLEPSSFLEISLSGNSLDIPYNEKNLVYKAIKAFYAFLPNLPCFKISVYIEKNIPIEAGMGGGSSNAAGVIYALNKLLKVGLSNFQINSLCAQLGSDLNVCYWGGMSLATSRGEKVEKLPSFESSISIIKPLNFGISAKQGYELFDSLKIKSACSTENFLNEIDSVKDLNRYLHNDLEIAPLKLYSVLQEIKSTYPESIMTGSGSAYFVLAEALPKILPSDKFLTIQGLNFVGQGVADI